MYHRTRWVLLKQKNGVENLMLGHLLCCSSIRSQSWLMLLQNSNTFQSQHPLHVAATVNIKGTVERDFLTPVFFTKRLILVSIDMPQSDFEIFRILTELFVLKLLKIDSPLSITARSQKQRLRQPIFLTLLKCSW